MGLRDWLARLAGSGDSRLYLTRARERLFLYSPKMGKNVLTATNYVNLAEQAIDGGYRGTIIKVGYHNAPRRLKEILDASKISPEEVSGLRKDLAGVVNAMGIKIENIRADAARAVKEEASRPK